METDPEEWDSRLTQKRMLTQIVAIPATLYFPTSIVAELNEICETLRYTPEQLVIEALRGQIDYWNEFYKHVMTLPVEPEDFDWPKDPVFCLACVTTVHIINNFARCSRLTALKRNIFESCNCGSEIRANFLSASFRILLRRSRKRTQTCLHIFRGPT
jgi:hypothetical protein